MNLQSNSLLRISMAVGTAVLLFLALFAFLNANVLAAPTAPLANDIRISQVYGGGGNSGAVYTHDFIELFNSGASPIDLTGWSVQYASSSGTSWQTTNLVGSLAPGQYYLIQQAQGAGGTTPLPTADVTGTIAMSGSNGKVALVNSTTALAGSCPGGVIDFVGFGSANCFEGSGATPSLSSTTAAIRNDEGCTDTDDNAADFTASAPTPRNTGSPTHSCVTGPVLAMTKSVQPATAVPHLSTITYTVVLENSGSVSETAVLLTDTLPVSTTFASWIEQPVGASETGDEITWSGTVTNGEAITFTFTADQTGDYGDTITNTATFSGTTSGSAEAGFTVESLAGDITFIYHDVEDVVMAGESVYLAGDFNSWNDSATPLSADAGFETFSVTLSALSTGTYNYKYIVYTDTVANGTPHWDWLNTNNRVYTVTATATVNDYRNVVPGYAVLSGPVAMTVTQTFPTQPISGELYINNVTNPAGVGRGLMAQNGFGDETDPGLWTWFDAAYIGQNGNNDIFQGVITPTQPGVFSYTNRFNGNWGMGNPHSVWTYGDLDGVYPGDPFELANTGVITVTAAGVCEINPSHRIHDIQGSGTSTPIPGASVSVNAVVVGDYQVGGYNGFFVQEMDQNTDADPMTSEGIFVYYPAFTVDVAVGDVVYVSGTAGEFNGLTQITGSPTVEICGTGASVTPATVTMPFTNIADLEWVEGMSVIFPDELTVTDNYNMGRFGEIYLSSSDRQMQYTHLFTPSVAGFAAHQTELSMNRLLVDDGRTDQNPLIPMPYLDPDGTLRAGSTITNMVGVMGYGFNNYRIQPSDPMTFTQSNPRESAPVIADLKIASLNVLNYFTTIDTGAAICGPNQDMGCRGADTVDELNRQRAKLLSALQGLDADIVGLMEIENNINDDAVIDLVDSLNAALGAGTYAYIDTGTIGTDAIKVALIYKPAAVSPVGAYAILDDSFDANYQEDLNRPSLAQTFADDATGGLVTVSVNHLKSKGSCPSSGPDVDQLDGQGCWNATRTAAAEILATWLNSDPTGSGSDNFLIIGDLNSYAMEDPIMALKDAGLTNLLEQFLGDDAYSYSFNGEFGYLDYALASPGLLPSVTDTTPWHINSDEPRALDYNDFNQAFFFNPDEFRASDHDPILIGLDLTAPTVSILSPTAGEVFTSTNGTAVSVPVVITTTDFVIPTNGHWHLWVDGVAIGPVMAYDTAVDLLPGAHVISAELRSPTHLSLGIVDSVSVTVNVQYVLYLPVIMKP